MKIIAHKKSASAFSLSMVLLFTGISLMLLTGILLWGSANGRLTARYNEFYASVRAAEAATEKVIAHMARDFQQSGFTNVNSNLASYRALIPTSAEIGVSTAYKFDDPTGISNQTYVAKLFPPAGPSSDWGDLKWKYTGFRSSNAIYRIVSNAINNDTRNNIIGAVKQEVQIASIPLFEFGAFYGLDMEVTPGVNFQVNGRVHCNGTIYCEPSANLTFADHVTASRSIFHQAHPNDSTVRTIGSGSYLGEPDGGATSLNLPLGQSTDPATLTNLIAPPQSWPPPSPSSLLDQQRYVYKADLVIRVHNGGIWAWSGNYNNFSIPISPNVITNFVTTTPGFTDKREASGFIVTEIDISRFVTNYATLMNATNLNEHDVRILYVADQRTQANKKFAVRLVNGGTLETLETLRPGGLTVATWNPLYVQGHFNAPDLATTNTSRAKPASLIADAITILSMSWQDSQNSSTNGTPANAGDTTVNAAILAGIVQTTPGSYSGGLENFLRLLEDWSSRTLTFNGSTVTLFPSQIATGPWYPTTYYSRPIRAYSFDNNFKNPTKLPPGTPELRTLIRADWAMIQPKATQ
jgi:hypothetical protein